MKQQIAISGLGGQGVLFLTRLLAETALALGLNVLSSETHGMAMRGGAVLSHLKIGPFFSPLIRAGQADVAMYLAEENLEVHPHLIGPQTWVIVNALKHTLYEALDAGSAAESEVGRRQAANLLLLGYAVGRGRLFCRPEAVREMMKKLGRRPETWEVNLKAFDAGLARAGLYTL